MPKRSTFRHIAGTTNSFGGALDQQMSPSTFKDLFLARLLPEDLPETPFAQAIMIRLQHIWAPSTWRSKSTTIAQAAEDSQVSLDVLLEFPDFLVTATVHSLEKRLSLGAMCTSTALTRLANITPVARILGASQFRLNFASKYMTSLKRTGALRVDVQAAPITRQQLIYLLAILPHELALPAWLAWKTASRWDEMHNLVASRVWYDEANQRILIQWLESTKTSKEDPYNPRFLTVVQWDSPLSMKPTPQMLERLKALGPDDRISPFPTRRILKLLAKFPADPRMLQMAKDFDAPIKDHLTGHSFKRGAVTELWQMAELGLIDAKTIELLAKHATPVPTGVGSGTSRYALAKMSLAVAHGTHRATRLL